MQPLFRRSIRYLFAVMLPAMIAVPVNAQAPAKEAPTAKAPADTSDPRDTIISEVSFDETPLEDVISYLQEASKTYRGVVIRKTGKEKGPLVTMRVRNVSVEQVLRIVQTANPNVNIQPVEGAGGAVDVIIVEPADQPSGFGGGMMEGGLGGMGAGLGGMAPGMPGGGGGFGPGGPAQDASTVRVYRLSGIIMDMKNKQGWAGEAAGEAKAQEAATANVLSLIKATMETLGGTEPPKLQLHPETQALIFSGSARQQAALEDVLAALESDRVIRSSKGDAAAAEADTRRVQKQLEASQEALEQARQENVLLKTELSAVQRQMDLQMQELVARNRQVTAEMEAVRAQLRDLESKTGKPR